MNPATSMATTEKIFGLFCAIVAGLVNALFTGIIQELSHHSFSVFSSTSIVYVLFILFTPPALSASQATIILPVKGIFWIFARTASTISGTLLLVLSTTYLPLGEVFIFVLLCVPMTAIGSACLLGEKCKHLDVISLLLTIAGSVLLMSPALVNLASESSWNTVIGGLLGLAAATCFTVSNLSYCYALRDINQWSVIVVMSCIIFSCGVVMVILNRAALAICQEFDRLLLVAASTFLFGAFLFTNLTFKYMKAGIATQTLTASEMVTCFVVQTAQGSTITWWSGSGIACVSLSLLINIVYQARTPPADLVELALPIGEPPVMDNGIIDGCWIAFIIGLNR